MAKVDVTLGEPPVTGVVLTLSLDEAALVRDVLGDCLCNRLGTQLYAALRDKLNAAGASKRQFRLDLPVTIPPRVVQV